MRLGIAVLAATFLAAPVLADPASDDGTKVKKVCRTIDTGNPMFPQRKCRTVVVDAPVKPAAATAATTAAADADAQNVQMAKVDKNPHWQ